MSHIDAKGVSLGSSHISQRRGASVAHSLCGRRGVADEETRRRYTQLELFRARDRDERCRAVVCIEKNGKQRITAPQAEEVDRLIATHRVDRARRAAFMFDGMIAARYAIQFIRSVQPHHVGERFPLQDVRVDVERVTRQLERVLRAIGKAESGREALRCNGLHSYAHCGCLVRQCLVTLNADGDATRQGAHGENQQSE